MIRSEKLCEGKLSTSLLEGFTCSEAAQSDCENRTVVWFKNDMPVLGLAGRHFGKWKLENCRYVCTTSWMGLRWPVPSMCPRAPCIDYIKMKMKMN